MATVSFWIAVATEKLAQGDLLPDCRVPIFFGLGGGIEEVSGRASEMGGRWRLAPPFLEHFSQAFARFFMRVGLPSSIPPYK